MILVTGGLGFIGSHTVRALLDAGEECVLVQRRPSEPSPVLADVTSGISIEQADVGDLASLREIGTRHPITGVIHLAGSMPWPVDPSRPIEQTRDALGGWFNIVQAAQEWGVKRIGLASTIGVYAGSGAHGALGEDTPLTMSLTHLIPTFKKISELLAAHLDSVTELDIVNYRISGTWGPLGHMPDPFFPGPSLVRAAANGVAPDLSGVVGGKLAGDGLDLSYVKDTARAIAALQLAESLNHRTYNVASGRATTNAEIAAAIRTVVPDAQVDLPVGDVAPVDHLDITRLQQDTGFTPEWDVERAVADYIAWFRAGHAR